MAIGRNVLLFLAAALCVAPSASQAQKKDPHRVIKVVKANPQNPVGSGVRAAKNEDTGELRTPTAEEEAQLADRGPKMRDTYVLFRADGSVTALLGDEFMDDAVAVKNADGSMTTSCVPHGTKLPAAPAAETR
jgi:hypothetical protein